MAGNYKIKIEPILNTASLNKQLNETKKLNKGSDNSTVGYRNQIIGYGSRIYFIC